ncbi:MAG: signal peptidase I [Vicinamibacterales bacterium]
MPSASRLFFGSHPRRALARVAILIVFSYALFHWVLIPVRTDGISMEPTYASGRLNLVNRLSYRTRPPARGDIVAIRLAGLHVLYLKRIIALPGERIAIVDGQVEVDGAPLIEPYVQHRRPWQLPEVQLGPAEYFVVGDNRGMNAVDHTFGRVDAFRIVGRVVF